jgi:hypothetical protein
MSLRAWGLQVIVMAVAFTVFFGAIVGKRGWDLALFVAILSLLLPTVILLARRRTR